jgi:hypothetical protein
MKILRLFALIVAVGLALGCDENEKENEENFNGQLEVCDTATIDDFELVELSVEGNYLKIDIRYGGGCQEHDFYLCWSGSLAITNPLQANLTLIHDSNGDMCEAYILGHLVFDITPLKVPFTADHGTIQINLEGQAVQFVF